MPFLFDMPYGIRGGGGGSTNSADNNWNRLYNPSAYIDPNAKQAPSGLGGTPPATIGSWPPTNYNPLAPPSGLGGTPPPTTGPSPTGLELFPGSGNQMARPGVGTGSLTTPYGGGPLSPAIQGLITPGLVPDIARMSAETAGGRGVGGSPAGASTAVKMSEADYLQRLGLANTLLTGEAGRALPYQITPLQAAELANRIAVAGMHNFNTGGSAGFGGYRNSPYGSPYGTRSGSGYSGGNFGGGYSTNPGSLYGGLGGYGSLSGGYGGGSVYGNNGGGSPSLDDMLRELGIFGEDDGSGGDYGVQPPLPPDWQYYE